jgi:PAS domain S-box-containing protein
MTLELIKGAALLFALSLLQSFNVRFWGIRKNTEKIVSGGLFGGICVIGMMMPLEVGSGVIFDARSVILSMSGLFGGPIVGVIAAVIAGGYRAWIGGGGANVGVAVVFSCMGLGLLYRYCWKQGWVKVDFFRLLVFGLAVHVADIALITQLPDDVVQKVMDNVALPLLLIFTPATAFLGMLLQDIENRTATEAALRLSEKSLRMARDQLESVLSNLPGGVFRRVLRPDGTEYMEYYMGQLARTLGLETQFGVNPPKLVSEFTFPEYVNVRDEAVRKSAEQMAPCLFEYPVRMPEGPILWVQSVSIPHRRDNGEIVWDGLNLDITERKMAEEKFRTAFDHVTVGNIVIDGNGIIGSCNKAAQDIFGYAAGEVIGQNVSMLMPEPYVSEHDTYIQNYVETTNPMIIGVGREVTGLRKNGEEFPMHLGIGVITSGGSESFIGSITDLTELKVLETQLRQSQKMEAVGQLTGGIAHDFNNLLAVMLGNTEMLGDSIDDEKAKHNIEALIKAVGRAESLTNRLLAFSRQQTLSPVAAYVTDLIGGLEDMLRRTLGETVDLRVEAGLDLWPATIDPHQFENALVNLAVNARDAMPQGGRLTVEIANVTLDETHAAQYEEVTPGDYVMVAVSDTGAGMPPEVLEKVFEPFFTTKEVGEGSGLGLSMVYGFVKQSNGHVTIDSEAGHGTKVELYMPRSREAVTRKDAAKDTPKFAPGSERILVVEDDESVREIPATILRDHGYVVVEAADAKQAIRHLKDGKPFDLLFTDVILPGGMNGVEIADQAKTLQPGIKVLYTTGYAENLVVHHGRLDPDKTLVNKPYRRAELLEKVRSMLDGKDDCAARFVTVCS